MIYLLTLAWPWFAGALALGALIGFVTYSRARDAAFSGGWIIALGVLALAAGVGISVAGLFEGRDAATLDIALAAGLAYAAGLLIGGWVKSLGGYENEKKPAAPAPVIVTPIRAAEPELEVAPTPASTPDEAALAPQQDDAPLEAPAEATDAAAPEPVASPPAPEPAAPPAKKKAPGVKPGTLAAPRGGKPDDLSRIKGVGPRTHEKLSALGVFHYDQIAAWNLDNAKWIGATIGAPGRVERDKWIQQARALAGAGAEKE